MSEERFSLKEWEDVNYCEHCFYDGESQLSDDDVVDLLNEQQATIQSLKTELELVSNTKLFSRRELERQVNEQQATINEQKEAIEYLKTVIRYTIPNQMVADVFKEIGEEYE